MKKKIIIYVIGIVLIQLLAIISTIPYYIPSWEMLMIGLLGILHIPIFFLAIVIFKQILKLEKTVFTFITIIVLSIQIGGGVMFMMLTAGQGFLGGAFYKEVVFEDQNLTFYLYDNSFLDPSTKIYVHDSFFPVMTTIGFESIHPSEVQVFCENDTVFIKGLTLKKYNIHAKNVLE